MLRACEAEALDEIGILLQQQPEYRARDDPGQRALAHPLCAQEYGMIEFYAIDLHRRRLAFAQATSTL
jgi:hypothetical protein